MTRRLGLRNHEYCRRVARRYKTGAIPMLPPDEAGLLAILGEIDGSFVAPSAKELSPFPVEPVGYSGHCIRCQVRVYNKTDWLCGGCSQLWHQISRDLEHNRMKEREAAQAWFLPSTP